MELMLEEGKKHLTFIQRSELSNAAMQFDAVSDIYLAKSRMKFW